MRKLSLLVVAAFLMMALAPCAMAEDVTTLRFMEVLASNIRSEWMEEKIAVFEAENPNIKIEREVVPWEQAHDRLVIMTAAGELPDVLETSDNWMAEFAAAGAYENLEPYFAAWEHKDDVAELAIDLGRMYEDTLYSIPYGLYIVAMMYRTDWLAEAGIEVPKTITEYYDAIAAVTNTEEGRYGYAFRGGAGCWGVLSMLLLGETATGDYFEADGVTCTLRRPEAARALQNFGDLYFNGCVPKDSLNWGYAETVDAFTSGVAAFLIQDTEVIDVALEKLGEEKFTTAMAPAGSDGNTYLIGGQAGLSISAFSGHKDEAWAFVSYMLQPAVNAEWGKTSWLIPSNKESLENPAFAEGLMAPVGEALLSDNVLLYSHPSYLPEWGEFYSNVSVEELQGFLLGEQTAEETLANISDYLETAQASYLAANE